MIPIPKLSIRIINLQRRTDRKRDALEEMAKLGLLEPSYQFFSAKLTPQNGAMGCSLSHAMALANWLFDTEDEHCLILEDDFSVRNRDVFWRIIADALQVHSSWDVLLLASNMAVPIEPTPLANVYRVINALSASAYIVGRRHAPKLIEIFFRSAELLRVYEGIPAIKTPEGLRRFFALDALWRATQQQDRFWACLPQVAFQRASYSDVENRFVSYGV